VIHASEQERPDVQQARQAWPQSLGARDAQRLIFLDETWFSTARGRLYGYAPRGQRLHATLPYGHWKTTTFLAGLTTDGLVAPLVLDGPLTSEAFAAYIEQVLAAETRPGDLVILDNLSSHKTARGQAAFAGCQIAYQYLPPYSPDFNPIENAFSKLKRLVRTAAERTVEGLWSVLGRLLDHFRPNECRSYFTHCGYSATRT
jgi:transposase